MNDKNGSDGKNNEGIKQSDDGGLMKGSPESSPPNSNETSGTSGHKQNNANNNSNAIMIKWTRIVGIFTGVLAVSALMGNFIIWWQLSIMQGQLAEMRAANERPYLMAYISEHNILRGDIDLKCATDKEERCFQAPYVSLVIENAGKQPAIIRESAIGVAIKSIKGPNLGYIEPTSYLLEDTPLATAMFKLHGACEGLEGVSRIPANGSIMLKCTPDMLDFYAGEILANKRNVIIRGAINYYGPASQEWQAGFEYTYIPPKIATSDIGLFKPNLDRDFTYDAVRGHEPKFRKVK